MADASEIGIRQFKALFFDKDAIGRAVGAATQANLSRQGAFIRRRMQSSIRYREKSSKPGEPPSGHRASNFKRTTTNKKTGVSKTRETSPLKELIFFGYDPSTRSVVIGPAKFGTGGGVVPRTLEKGGPAAVIEPVPRAKGRKATERQSQSFQRLVKAGRIILPPRTMRIRTFVMAPRPFVRPAGEAEAKSTAR